MTERIVIIDSDDEFSAELGALCTQLGFDVECNHGNDEAVEKITENTPKLAIVGQSNNADDGYACCSRLRNEHPDLPVLMVIDAKEYESARLEQHKHQKRSADAYLVRPFDGHTFIEALKGIVEVDSDTETGLLDTVVGNPTDGAETKGPNASGFFEGQSVGVTEDEAERALDALLDPNPGDEDRLSVDGPPARPPHHPGTIALTDEDLYDELVLEELPLEEELLTPSVDESSVSDGSNAAELQQALTMAHEDAAQRSREIVALRGAEEELNARLQELEANSKRRDNENDALRKQVKTLEAARKTTAPKKDDGEDRSAERQQAERQQAEHLSEILEMQREQARVMVALEEELAAKERRVVAARDQEHLAAQEALRKTQAESVEKLGAEHAAELGALKTEHEAALIVLRNKNDERVQSLGAESDSALEVLRSQHSTEIESLTSRHASNLDEQVQTERTTASAIKSSLEEKLTAQSEKSAKRLEKLEGKSAKKIGSLETKHAGAIESLNKKHAGATESLNKKHADATESLNKKHLAKFEAAATANESAIFDLNQAHEAKLAAEDAKQSAESDKQAKAHAKAISKLESKFESLDKKLTTRIESLEGKLDVSRSETKDAQGLLKESNKEASGLGKELARANKKLEDLQTRHEEVTANLEGVSADARRLEMALGNETRARADDLIELNARHADLKEKFQIDTDRIATLDRALDALNKELAEQEKRLAKQASAAKKVEKRNAALEAQLEEAEARYSAREANFEKLRTAIAVANVFADGIAEDSAASDGDEDS